MTEKELLATIQAGDKVFISSNRFGTSSRYVRTVDRLTAKQFVVGNSRYRRDNGKRIGDGGYSTEYLRHASAEALAEYDEEYQKRLKIAKIQGVSMRRFSQLSTDDVNTIFSILKPVMEP